MVQHMLHQLKYKNKPDLAYLLGQWYAQDIKNKTLNEPYDYIIPVPLHRTRLQKRGYNQSEHFAMGLSSYLHVPVCSNVLLKSQHTETQTRKNREERIENTLHSFSMMNSEIIKGKHILLVDDVITTGATIEACCLQLQEAKPAFISVASIAFAVSF